MSRLEAAAAAAEGADRHRRHRAGARARGAPARVREAGRAALHRPRHRRVARRSRRREPLTSAGWTISPYRRAAARAAAAGLPARRRALPVRAPAVVEQEPFDCRRRRRSRRSSGSPAGTSSAQIARLEAAGGVERWTTAADGRPGARARASSARTPSSGSSAPSCRAGSAARRATGSLKCLHAHAAFALARPGYELGDRILAEAEPLWPGAAAARPYDRRVVDVELARHQWAEGRRALERARDDRAAYARLNARVECSSWPS